MTFIHHVSGTWHKANSMPFSIWKPHFFQNVYLMAIPTKLSRITFQKCLYIYVYECVCVYIYNFLVYIYFLKVHSQVLFENKNLEVFAYTVSSAWTPFTLCQNAHILPTF